MKNTNKSFKKFTSRTSAKERGKREMMKMLESIGIDAGAAKFKFTDDRYHSSKKGDIIAEGVFRESSSGYGFVSVEGEARDIFIPESATGAALDSDKVKIKY